MSGERAEFDPLLQEPLDAGWIDAAQAWALDRDAWADPPYTAPDIRALWARVELFHAPWRWSN